MTQFFQNPLSYPLYLTPLVFLLGSLIGSLLNVCILRMPLEKSIFWPGSHCGNCFKAIWFRDNLPIIGYLLRRGKCRHCGATFSSRYMWIELLTALIFVGTFLYYVTLDSHGAQGLGLNPFEPSREMAQKIWGIGPWNRLSLVCLWVGHLFLLCCLLVTTFTDMDCQEIPLRITIFGTIMGIIFGTLMPWPWPCNPFTVREMLDNFGMHPMPTAMQLWPWWPPAGPEDWPAMGTWQFGLINSVLGAVVGTGLIRAIRFIFGWGFGKEAMGLGDADLMMMIGAFLGWQSVILVLIYAVFLGILYVLYVILFNPKEALPFGPFLAGGVLLTLYAAPLIAWAYDPEWMRSTKIGVQYLFFFNPTAVMLIVVLSTMLAFTMAFILRLLRLVFRAPKQDVPPEERPQPRATLAPVPATMAVTAPTPVKVTGANSSPPPQDSTGDEEEPVEKQASGPARKKGKKKKKK
jgi:leader peptidase (prepilin peptidase)/N-methyltransferase